MSEMDTSATSEEKEEVEPEAFGFDHIKSMVAKGEELVEKGIQAGTVEFNRLGGLDWHGFRAWRERHAEGIPAEDLDAIHAHAPIDPEVESDEAREARQAEEEKPAVLDDGSPGPGATAEAEPAAAAEKTSAVAEAQEQPPAAV